MALKGIDVSRWQGDIDWKKVKESGIEFAIIKAGGADDGLYKDSKFEKNYSGAKAAGIPVGCYYFNSKNFITKEKALEEAKHFLSIIEGKQFEYPVYCDIEAQSGSKRDITDATKEFCNYIEKQGYWVGIYGSDIAGFTDRLIWEEVGKRYATWIARYGGTMVHSGHGLRQLSDSGKVSGISGNVDLDEGYIDYPKLIKAKGLNGFGKQEETKEEVKEEVKDTTSTPSSVELNVMQKQAILLYLGYYEGAVDGSYSESFKQSVKDFQEASNIAVDGDFGKDTTKAAIQAVSESRFKVVKTQESVKPTLPSYSSGYVGRLKIKSAGIDVGLYAGCDQSITDAQDSANYMEYNGESRESVTIADHSNQAFKTLTSIKVGDTGTITYKDGEVRHIKCVEAFNGHNTGSLITDANYVSVQKDGARSDFILYTCMSGWQNVRVCLFNLCDSSEVDFWDTIQYFKRSEFACPCGKCGGFPVEPDKDVVRLMDKIRGHFGVPISPHSAVRCKSHNSAVGGVAGSQHLLGKAVDFHVNGVPHKEVYDYCCSLLPGTGGVGIYNWGVHVDTRKTKARFDYR